MTYLSLFLLGTFQAHLDGQPVQGLKPKARALAAFLAVEAHRPHHRETLAAMLWPECSDQEALSNLRFTLSNLRSCIDDRTAKPSFLLITRETIQFNVASHCFVDVLVLMDACQICSLGIGSSSHEIERLSKALDLYQGHLLEGFNVSGSLVFEEWSLLKQNQLEQMALTALDGLAEWHEQHGQNDAALKYARRQIELEYWQESAHQRIMRLLAFRGKRTAALAHYQEYCDQLAQELGAEPDPATIALYESIRGGGSRAVTSPAPAPRKTPQPPGSPIAFVARKEELGRLDHLLDMACAGDGSVAFVAGDAGTGKTALAREFARRLLETHSHVLVAGGSSDEQSGVGDPYLPFREILQMLTGDIEVHRAEGSITNAHAQRLWAALPDTIMALVEAGADLIGRLTPASPLLLRLEAFGPWTSRTHALRTRLQNLIEARAALAASPELFAQAALFEQYSRTLQAIAARYPLVLILDDLQWADAGSISLLFHLARRLGGSRILILGLYRPGEVARGRGEERHPLERIIHEVQRQAGDIVLDLNYGEGDESRFFVEALLDSRPNRLGRGFRDLFYQRTGGNALFAVELLRGMEVRGDLVRDEAGRWQEGPALDWTWLPARVEAVMAERIAGLPDGMLEILEAASVQGDEFYAEVIAIITRINEEDINKRLGWLATHYRLIRPLGIERRNGLRLSRYGFRHSVYRSFLYDGLDKIKQAALHEAVGLALEVMYRNVASEAEGGLLAPETVSLAWHFEQAGIAEKAIDYLLLASKRAYLLGANQAALSLLNRGLALLPREQAMPGQDSMQWARRELALELNLSIVLMSARGWSAPEAIRACARAYELAQHLGEPLLIRPVLPMLASLARGQGNLAESLHYGQQLLDLAQQAQDTQHITIGHWLVGTAGFMLADFDLARQHLEQAVALYTLEQHPQLVTSAGIDIGADSLGSLMHILLALGYPDRAADYCSRALALARRLDHALTTGMVMGLICFFYYLRRQYSMIYEYQAEMLQLATAKQLPQIELYATIIQSWCLIEQGQSEQGMAQITSSLAAWQASGTLIGQPFLLMMTAQAHAKAGQLETGLSLLDKALGLIEDKLMRLTSALVWRLRGELLLQTAQMNCDERERQAEACFERAIEIARRQDAKMWELKAVVSLCRLWLAQEGTDKRENARRRLAEICGRFTEGFDLPDLREAGAMLDDLGQVV